MKSQVFFTIALLMIPMIGWANPDTPGEAKALQVQPYENAFYNSTAFATAMTENAYAITEGRTDPGPTTPSFKLSDYISYLGIGFGVIWIESHGNDSGHAVETYELSSTGLNSRNQNWNNYLNSGGLNTTQIYRGTSAHGHSIGIKDAKISSSFVSKQTAIINKSCYSTSYANSWNNSRVHVGFSGGLVSDGDSFFGELKDGNTFNNAVDGLMVLSGEGNTILAPRVESTNFGFHQLVPPEGLEIVFNFTAKCTGNVTTSSEPGYVCNDNWSSDNQYTATICPNDGQTGQVWLIGGFTSNNGIPLKHATNQWCVLVGSNSAADVSFGIKDNLAIWRVGSEYKTEAYLLEASYAIAGPWQQVGPEHAPGFFEYQTDISTVIAEGKDWFRLVEREESGHRIIHGYSQANPGLVPPRIFNRSNDPNDLALSLAKLEDDRRNGMLRSGLPRSIGQGQSLAIYTLAEFAPTIENYYANYWRYYGYNVVVEIVSGRPQTATEEDAQIAHLQNRIATNSANGFKYHELWGRDNDYHYLHGERWSQYWTGPWITIRSHMVDRYVSVADDIGIPALTLKDDKPRNQNISYWWPYFRSDALYQLPGTVVTRVPVSNTWEIMVYSLVIQETNDYWFYPGYGLNIGFFVGDMDHMGQGDGLEARQMANQVKNLLQQSGHYLSEIYESEVPNPQTRNMLLADQWNGYLGGRTNLNFMYASQSGPHYPGNMYSKREQGQYAWRMDLVYPFLNHHPMFIAPTCGTAASWPTDDSWYYHTPVVVDMLFDQAGASGYYGPGCGSITSVNGEIGYIIAQKVIEDFFRPVFESIALAEEQIATLHGDDPLTMGHLWTMSKIGSSLTRVGGVDAIVGVDNDLPPAQTSLGQNFPNPFNPKTSIRFELEKRDSVVLKIFDLRGSLIATLADEILPAGLQERFWDGTDFSGRQMPSGIYFYRLETDNKSISRKMLLLK